MLISSRKEEKTHEKCFCYFVHC